MPINDPKEVFVQILSSVRQGTEQTTKIFQEISQVTQHPDIKEAMEARIFVSDTILAKLDQCFEFIGEEPVKLSGRLHDVVAVDFRNEVAEIQNPMAKHLFHSGHGKPTDSPPYCRIRHSNRSCRYDGTLWRWCAA